MHDLLTFAMAMLTITNPAGSMAIFAGLTGSETPADRKLIAAKTSIAIGITLLVLVWIGGVLLAVLGVSVPGLQMAGGVIVALMGLSMLQTKTSQVVHTPSENREAKEKDASIAVVPMAIPIIVGPGTMTTIILATTKQSSVTSRLMLSAVCLGVTAIIWICLHFSGPLTHRLGVAGTNIVTRIMGIVLTAIAFGMLTAGLKAALPGLAG